jgi:hypothetical protein
MSDAVPAGAFDDCEKWEQELATKELGGTKKAFTSRRQSLATMRTVVNAHDAEVKDLDERLGVVEGVIRDRPF